MHRWMKGVLAIASAGAIGALALATGAGRYEGRLLSAGRVSDPVVRNAVDLVTRGREVFRYDTFGDEVFWGDTLRLHEGVATVSPRTALAVGLKVDVEALPKNVQQQLKHGNVDLDSPATTLALLKLDAVVGVTG